MIKFHYSVFLLLQKIHNFSYSVSVIKSSKPEYPGNLKNLWANLKKNNTNILISGGILSPDAVDQVSFLFAFWNYESCLFFQQPKKSTMAILKPFSANAWLAITGVSILMVFAIKMAFVQSESDDETSWFWSFFVVLSALWQADVTPCHEGTTWRFIFYNLMLTSLILHCYYTSSMVSLLLNPQKSAAYSVADLAASNFNIYFDNEPFTLDSLQNSKLEDVQKLFKTKIKNKLPQSDGVAKILEKNFGFYTDASTAYDIIGRNFNQDAVCSLLAVPIVPGNMGGMVLHKNFEFNKMFRISILRLRQTGYLQKLLRIWVAEKPECHSIADVVPLGMGELAGCFAFLLLGILVSFAIMVLEIKWYHKRN